MAKIPTLSPKNALKAAAAGLAAVVGIQFAAHNLGNEAEGAPAAGKTKCDIDQAVQHAGPKGLEELNGAFLSVATRINHLAGKTQGHIQPVEVGGTVETMPERVDDAYRAVSALSQTLTGTGQKRAEQLKDKMESIFSCKP